MRGGRLVGDYQRRAANQGHGDHHPLLHEKSNNGSDNDKDANDGKGTVSDNDENNGTDNNAGKNSGKADSGANNTEVIGFRKKTDFVSTAFRKILLITDKIQG